MAKQFQTAAQGEKDAIDDNKGGWIEPSLAKDEEAMKNHLEAMVGGTEKYRAAYAAKAKQLVC